MTLVADPRRVGVSRCPDVLAPNRSRERACEVRGGRAERPRFDDRAVPAVRDQPEDRLQAARSIRVRRALGASGPISGSSPTSEPDRAGARGSDPSGAQASSHVGLEEDPGDPGARVGCQGAAGEEHGGRRAAASGRRDSPKSSTQTTAERVADRPRFGAERRLVDRLQGLVPRRGRHALRSADGQRRVQPRVARVPGDGVAEAGGRAVPPGEVVRGVGGADRRVEPLSVESV